jgi:hypothetical protein
MDTFGDYCVELMETAKGFRAKAAGAEEDDTKQAYLRAALLHAFSFLEAHLNYLAEHFEHSVIYSVNEKGVLLEREVTFERGVFALTTRSKFSRMTDRIELLLGKGTATQPVEKNTWFSPLKDSIKVRNALVHPREAHVLTDKQLDDAMIAILTCVDALYRAALAKPLPYAKKGLDGGLPV